MAEEIYNITDGQEIDKDKKIQELEEKLVKIEQKFNNLNKNLEDRVLERTVEIRRLLIHKNRFIDNLSHDLGTPLTPLITLLPVIKEEIKDENTIKLIDTCIRNSEYIKRVVDNTRKLAELSTSDLFLKEENLHDIVEELIDKYDVVFKSFKIEANNNIEKDVIVKTEKSRLIELFDQVTSNAVYAMQNGGKIYFDSKNVKHKDESFIQISVTDTGIGLTREQMDHVFDEFYKVDESRHKLDSTGLGLPICKRIIEKHDGKIWIDSHGPNTGSTLYFLLPSTKFTRTRSF